MTTEKDYGFFKRLILAQSPDEIFHFCQDKKNVEKVLTDLPIELTLLSAKKLESGEYEIKWKNRPDSKIQGTLNLLLKKAPRAAGTIFFAEAVFNQGYF